jgi:hypothetical protein
MYLKEIGCNSLNGIQLAWAGFREWGNESLGSVKGGECFDQLSSYQLLKKDFVSWN